MRRYIIFVLFRSGRHNLFFPHRNYAKSSDFKLITQSSSIQKKNSHIYTDHCLTYYLSYMRTLSHYPLASIIRFSCQHLIIFVLKLFNLLCTICIKRSLHPADIREGQPYHILIRMHASSFGYEGCFILSHAYFMGFSWRA